jgi:hypothetical protein
MATNIEKCAQSKSRNLNIIKQLYRLTRRTWYSEGTPTVDAADADDYGAVKGDLAYDYTNKKIYVCTVAPESPSTNATFVEITQGR